MSTLHTLIALLALAPLTLCQDAASDDEGWLLGLEARPPALHLGSYSSRLAAKLGTDGVIDTGFCLARLVRGPNDPIEVPYVDLPVARQWGLIGGFENDVGIALSVLGVPIRAGSDERLVVPGQFRLENIADEPRTVRFGIELMAGVGAGYDRPWSAVDFTSDPTFTRDEHRILRDGRVVMSWKNTKPALVEAAGEVSSPTDSAAVVLWELELQPGATRLLEFKLVGPPAFAPSDESPFRDRMDRQPYVLLAESLGWESGDLGTLGGFYPASDELRWMVLGNQLMLRSYGVANDRIEFLTDRPYGHEPTDAAVPAEALAALFEWGFADRGVAFLERLIDDAQATCQSLSPARRVAYLHALVRCMRLAGGPHPRSEEVADLIIEFVDEPVEVPAWSDPTVVREDLVEMLADAGRPVPDSLPELRWASGLADDTASARFLAHRRALNAGESGEAWAQIEALYPYYSATGRGADVIDGMSDGKHALATMSIVRETLIDDHGGELQLFPGVDYGFIRLRSRYPGIYLPSRYGSLRAELYHAGRGIIGGRFSWTKTREPSRTLYHVPESATGTKMNWVEGGRARIFDEDTVEVKEYNPYGAFGFRFSLHVSKLRGLD